MTRQTNHSPLSIAMIIIGVIIISITPVGLIFFILAWMRCYGERKAKQRHQFIVNSMLESKERDAQILRYKAFG